MKNDCCDSSPEKPDLIPGQEILPTLDELKMEYLEYLLETDVRKASGPSGIREISRAALARRLALFNLGGPPPPIVLNRKARICH